MAFSWNRWFFHSRPENGPATIPVDLGASHHHLPNSNQWAVVTLFGAIAVLYFARTILIPLAFAVTLTFVLSPVVALLERSRMGRAASVAVTVLVMLAVAVGVGWIIVVQLVDVAEDLPIYRQNINAKMEAL